METDGQPLPEDGMRWCKTSQQLGPPEPSRTANSAPALLCLLCLVSLLYLTHLTLSYFCPCDLVQFLYFLFDYSSNHSTLCNLFFCHLSFIASVTNSVFSCQLWLSQSRKKRVSLRQVLQFFNNARRKNRIFGFFVSQRRQIFALKIGERWLCEGGWRGEETLTEDSYET